MSGSSNQTPTKTEGTGLGLATVYGVVTQAGGYVSPYSEVGHGSTFRVYLPESTEEAVRKESSPRQLVPGSGTILLVEDQVAVRNLSRKILEESGYRVLEAGTGREALEYEGHEGTIDLLIVDAGLPDMSGAAVAAAFCERHPEARVLFVSGYSDGGPQGSAFLAKPYTPRTLTETVRKLLE